MFWLHFMILKLFQVLTCPENSVQAIPQLTMQNPHSFVKRGTQSKCLCHIEGGGNIPRTLSMWLGTCMLDLIAHDENKEST